MTSLPPPVLSAFGIACASFGTAASAGVFPAVSDMTLLEPGNGGDGRAGIVLNSSLPGHPGYDLDAAIVPDLDGAVFPRGWTSPRSTAIEGSVST